MVTDEMVEKAAEAYWMQVYGRHRKSNKWTEDVLGSSQGLFRDGCRAALEAALSAAEPVAAMTKDYLGCEYVSMDVAGIEKIAAAHSKGPTEVAYLYAAPPAPPVAVKALEWVESIESTGRYASAKTPIGGYDVFDFSMSINGKTKTVTGWSGHWINAEQRTTTFDEAKAAAQADYEARILSALSAQVQDVAGWQEVPPETVIEEATKGKQVLAYENGRYYNAWLEFEASEGGWLWYDEADSEPNPTHWMPLPAAPAKQEG